MNGDWNNPATKGDIERLRSRIDDIPNQVEKSMLDKIKNEIRLHKAECRASDVVKLYEKPADLTFYERIKQQPEIPTIPSVLVAIIILLARLGII